MARYARIENDIVAEIFTLSEGLTLENIFPPAFAARYRPCGPDVSEGWLLDDGAFTPPPPPAPQPPTVAEAKAECARRIFAAASGNTQNNLNAYMNWLALKSGTLTSAEKADVAAFGEAFQWIAAMRAKWKVLHAAGDADFREDAKWPVLPPAAAALAARF